MSDEEIDALKHRAMGAFKTHLLYSSATEQVRANVIVDLVQALTELQLEATSTAALTAKHEELYGVFVFWRAEADKLREQLDAARADTEKAVEALRELVQLNDDYSPFGGEMFQDRVNRTWDRARATLAEIEGEKT